MCICRLAEEDGTDTEEKSHHSRNNAPPSRHLWVGNLSHNLAEHTLANHFLQFGELESVAFQPGRSYAFINFKNDEDAFVAVRALQGFVVGGNALKIEFAKAVSFVHLCLSFLRCTVAIIYCRFNIFHQLLNVIHKNSLNYHKLKNNRKETCNLKAACPLKNNRKGTCKFNGIFMGVSP